MTTFGLEPVFAERVWGKTDLRPWYNVQSDRPLGEAWLTGPECLVAGGAGERLRDVAPHYPLLVKMLFPSEKLSVQVHPDDAQARTLGLERGKTECWYVLEAVDGATVACGLRDGVTTEALRAAIAAGTAEDQLEWLPVAAGDMVFVDAGTVHAIGPGMTLLEVQQTCDVTYRLYDYGRPRELHLEAGLAVVKQKTAAGKVQPRHMDGFTRLIETAYFVVDRYELAAGQTVELESGCLAGLAGTAVAGQVALVPGSAVIFAGGTVRSEAGAAGAAFVRCWVPGES